MDTAKPPCKVTGGRQIAQEPKYRNPDHGSWAVDKRDDRASKKHLSDHQTTGYTRHFLLPHEDPLEVDCLGEDGHSVDEQHGAETRVMGKQGQENEQGQETERGQQQAQRNDTRSQRWDVGGVGGFAYSPHFEAAVGHQKQVSEYRPGELKHAEARHPETSRQINKSEETGRFGKQITRSKANNVLEWAGQRRAPLSLKIYHGSAQTPLTE